MTKQPSPSQRAATIAFEAEVRDLIEHGLLELRSQTEAEEFGRKAARLLAEREQVRGRR